MPVAVGDLKLYQATTMAASFSTSNVGGGASVTQITGGSIGEMFFSMPSNLFGGAGGTKTQYTNVKAKNTHSTDSLESGMLYAANSLDDNTAAGAVKVSSSSVDDDATKYVRVIGLDNGGSSTPQTDDITMNGTIEVTGVKTFKTSGVCVCEVRATTGGALIAADDDITIKVGTQTLGIIPRGRKTAIAFFSFGIDGSLNTSGTIADAGTAPSGITFTKPRTAAAATGLPATLTAGSYITIWGRWQLPEGLQPNPDWEAVIRLRGNAA